VVQVFDSWVGALNAADYREFALPHTQADLRRARGRVPTIHFGTGTSTIFPNMREAGGDVIGADWRIPIDDAWNGSARSRDPGQPRSHAAARAHQPHARAGAGHPHRVGGRPGHIFNLGHGILPSTPVEHVQLLAPVRPSRLTTLKGPP
jgi:uroporphyrinogen decarboxylase